MDYIIYTVLVLLGLILGSFAGASVWRLRARQLSDDKQRGEKLSQSEYNKLEPLMKTTIKQDRSRCLHCGYMLRWYDLIPLVSWLQLGGKCRTCHRPIGYMEPLVEIGVAAFFVLSYAFWPYTLDNTLAIAQLIIWLVSGVALAILFCYDAKWYLLPTRTNYIVVGLGAVYATLAIITSANPVEALVSTIAGVGVLSGLYAILYVLSKGRMIGFGDIILSLGLALLLADWQLAFIALFAANFIGCLIVIPGLATGKLKRRSHVPFGPFLIAGWAVAGLWGYYLIDLYVFNLL